MVSSTFPSIWNQAIKTTVSKFFYRRAQQQRKLLLELQNCLAGSIQHKPGHAANPAHFNNSPAGAKILLLLLVPLSQSLQS